MASEEPIPVSLYNGASLKETILMVSRWLFLAAGILAITGCPQAQTNVVPESTKVVLQVAAASDLKFALNEFAQEFQRVYPTIELSISYGSSGKFYTQLSQGAPFDVYLSADIDYPQKLVASGHAIKDSLVAYACGQLVLWVRQKSPLDLEQGLDVLLDERVQKISIANPQHAPYGRAAKAALETAGILSQVESKLVLGENVSQAAQFVESGNADIGLIALSLAKSPTLTEQGRYQVVPKDNYPELVQGAVIPSRSPHQKEAGLLLQMLISKKGQALLARYGFSSVQATEGD